MSAPDWADFDWSKFSVIRFGLSVPAPDSHLVTADQFRAVVMAVRKIHASAALKVTTKTGSTVPNDLIVTSSDLPTDAKDELQCQLTEFSTFAAWFLSSWQSASRSVAAWSEATFNPLLQRWRIPPLCPFAKRLESGPMAPHWMGQSALPILEGSNAHSQFGAELSLGEAVRRTVLKKHLRQAFRRISERVRIPPWSGY